MINQDNIQVVWKTGIKLLPGEWLRAGANGEYEVVRKAADRDVTEECFAELRKSAHSDGFYVAVVHGDKTVLALGLDGNSKHILRVRSYRMVKADGSVVSFRVKKLG